MLRKLLEQFKEVCGKTLKNILIKFSGNSVIFILWGILMREFSDFIEYQKDILAV